MLVAASLTVFAIRNAETAEEGMIVDVVMEDETMIADQLAGIPDLHHPIVVALMTATADQLHATDQQPATSIPIFQSLAATMAVHALEVPSDARNPATEATIEGIPTATVQDVEEETHRQRSSQQRRPAVLTSR